MSLIRGLKTARERVLGKDSPKTAVVILLILLCVGVTYYFHFVLGRAVVFTHLFYVPVALAGLWWGRRGVWVAVLLGALLLASHFLSGMGTPALDCFVRSVMFVAVGLTVGFLREQAVRWEKSLRETRDYLDSLIRYANAPIIVWNPEGRITRFNAAFEHLTGYRAGEVIGRELDMLLPEASRDESLRKIARTMSDGYWEWEEIPILCQDGDIRIVLWNSANIYAEDGTTLLATIAQGTDITERKRAEEEVKRRSEELAILNAITATVGQSLDLDEILDRALSKVVEATRLEAKGGIFLLDAEGQKLRLRVHHGLSPEFVRREAEVAVGECLCGLVAETGEVLLANDSFEDARHTRCRELDPHSHIVVPLKSRDQVLGVMFLYPQGTYQPGAADRQLFASIGSQIGVAVENAQLYQRERQRRQELGEAQDVMLSLLEDVDEARQEVEQKVIERTRELRETQAQLVQAGKMAALGQLAGGVAHELNNPLTGVLIYAKRLLKKADDQALRDNEAFRVFPESLRLIDEAAIRCKTITDSLLTFSRQAKFEFAPLDVNQVIENTLTLIRSQLKFHRITLIQELQPDLPPVVGNPNQLQQVFTNLIINAQQAMPDGGQLVIKTSEVSGKLPKSEWVTVSFTDTGCGIPEENLDKIFEPFFTTQPVGQGTGLGLSISYGIVDAHNGFIEVESQVGVGSTFTVFLPVGN